MTTFNPEDITIVNNCCGFDRECGQVIIQSFNVEETKRHIIANQKTVQQLMSLRNSHTPFTLEDIITHLHNITEENIQNIKP